MLKFLTHYHNFNPMYNFTDIILKWQFIKVALLDAAPEFVPISKPKSQCRPNGSTLKYSTKSTVSNYPYYQKKN